MLADGWQNHWVTHTRDINMKHTSGIYGIKNKINNKIYIGSSKRIEYRFKQHKCLLRRNAHKNPLLQLDYNEFGEDNFELLILEISPDNIDLLNKEEIWKTKYQDIYNIMKFKNIPNLDKGEIDRFWSKVEIQGDDDCWPWVSSIAEKGKPYGIFRHKKKRYIATRIMYYLIYGPYDYTLLLCHTCSNPNCVNPNHLYLGSYSDNSKDMTDKGRGHACKINFDIATKIRNKYKEIGIASSRFVRKWLLEEYGISVDKTNILNIIKNKSYIDENYKCEKLYRLCEQSVDKIRELYLQGHSITKIAEQLYISKSNVDAIAKNKRWPSEEYKNKLEKSGIIGSHCGEKHHGAKLKLKDISFIRELHIFGISYSAIAGAMGVTHSNICCICNNKTWYSEEYAKQLADFKLGVYNSGN